MNFNEQIMELESYKCVSKRVITLSDPEGSRRIILRLINKSQVMHCYIKTSDLIKLGESCDFVINKNGLPIKMLLELKGDGNKKKAVSQINSSWSYLKQHFPGEFDAIIAIIVADKCSTTILNRIDLLKLKDKCLSTGGKLYDIKSNIETEIN